MQSQARLGILLSQLALCIVLVGSAFDALRVHGELSQALVRQKQNDEVIAKIETQLDALARGTQQLAQRGNAHAAAVVAALEQNGIRINPQQPAR